MASNGVKVAFGESKKDNKTIVPLCPSLLTGINC
jgi:hypothetical protein